MARSAGAATTVLDSLRYLYDIGGELDLAPGEVIAGLEQIGIDGFTDDQEAYFAMTGTVLRLLLRHAAADAHAMFAATRENLAQLGRDIDTDEFER